MFSFLLYHFIVMRLGSWLVGTDALHIYLH